MSATPGEASDRTRSRAGPARQRFRLIELMALIIGLAVALCLIVPSESGTPGAVGSIEGRDPIVILVFTLGGLSLVGPPLLIWERMKRRGGPWGAGKFLWFTQGMASWLLWPPIAYSRVRGAGSSSAACYLYGTPLMAVYVTTALLAGGWLRRKRRRRFTSRSWRERFGLVLGLAWACTGLYILFLLYSEDFRR